MSKFESSIGNCPVSISIGNMVREKAGAYLIPQFDSEVVFGGVAGAVARAGAMRGMEEFADYMDKNGPLPFGTIWPTRAGGGNSDWLINAISVKSGDDTAFDVIRDVTYKAMKLCGDEGVGKIIFPALGTGILRELTDEQSAKAMLSGIDKYASEGGNPVAASFVFLDGSGAQSLFDAYKTVIETKAYASAGTEVAAGKIDFNRWARGMDADAAANQEYARNHPAGTPTEGIKVGKPLQLKPKTGRS